MTLNLRKVKTLEDRKFEKIRLFHAVWFPLLFVAVLWAVKGIEILTDSSFSRFGLYPLEIKGLRGILFAPFIHGSWEHLINNSIPVFILILTLFYFYHEISFKVFILLFFIHNFWLWFFGRDAYHIGASGIIYGLGAFLFVSGMIRKNTHLMAISMLMAFLYGSMVWGIFPLVESVSWEGHLTGMVAGIVLAFYYRQYGPSPNFGKWKYEYPEDDAQLSESDNEYWKITEEKEEEERKAQT